MLVLAIRRYLQFNAIGPGARSLRMVNRLFSLEDTHIYTYGGSELLTELYIAPHKTHAELKPVVLETQPKISGAQISLRALSIK